MQCAHCVFILLTLSRLPAPQASTTIVDCHCDNGEGGSLTTIPNEYVGCALAATQTVTIEDLKPTTPTVKPFLDIALYISGRDDWAVNEWIVLYARGLAWTNETICSADGGIRDDYWVGFWFPPQGEIYDDTTNRYLDNASFPYPDANHNLTYDPIPERTNCRYNYVDKAPGYLECDQGHVLCIPDEAAPVMCPKNGVTWPRVKCPLFDTNDVWADLGGT